MTQETRAGRIETPPRKSRRQARRLMEHSNSNGDQITMASDLQDKCTIGATKLHDVQKSSLSQRPNISSETSSRVQFMAKIFSHAKEASSSFVTDPFLHS